MNGEKIVQAINDHISAEVKTVHQRIDTVKNEITSVKVKLEQKADEDDVVELKQKVTKNTTNVYWLIRIISGGTGISLVGGLIAKFVGFW